MDNKILFAELTKEGILNSDIAEQILKEAAASRRDAEELMYERRVADEKGVAKLKSRLLGIPYKEIDIKSIPDDLLKVIPEETVRNYKIIPINRTSEMLVVGMLNPDDVAAQEALRFIAKQLRLNLGVYLITYSNWEAMTRRYIPYKSEVTEALSSIKISAKGGASSQRVVGLEEGMTIQEEAPVIKIVASTLKEAVFEKASDIHIEPQRESLRVRFRLDGDLQVVSTLPIELHQSIISRIKVLSNLRLDETRIPQDGRFRTILFGRDIDFRVSTFPTTVGEKVAIRVLDPTVGLKGLENLGFLTHNYELVKEGINKPFGMVLLTGPTGSGKTTTLYSIMQLLNKEDVNVLSLEDPVEYFIEGLNQSQVRPEIGYDFASGLRQILRQDPDIIMVGEIRDEETAGLTVHAALTGHIVLSTLHTNNTLGVIPRLIDMKVEPFLLPSSLNLMLAQRLVARLCEKCRKPERASQPLQVIIRDALGKLSRNVLKEFEGKIKNLEGPYDIYHGQGCDNCKSKGIIGRVALFEVFRMTPELEEIISGGPTEHKILEESRRQGMVTMRQDGVLKALLGLVPIEEVIKETTES